MKCSVCGLMPKEKDDYLCKSCRGYLTWLKEQKEKNNGK